MKYIKRILVILNTPRIALSYMDIIIFFIVEELMRLVWEILWGIIQLII